MPHLFTVIILIALFLVFFIFHIYLIKRREKSKILKSVLQETESINQKLKVNEQLLKESNNALLEKEMVLKTSEMRYQMILEHMDSGMALYETVDNGNDFVFKEFNSAAEKMTKISRKQLLGKRVTEVFPGINEMGLLDVLRRVSRTGQPELFPTSYYSDANLKAWHSNYVYKLGKNEIVALFSDESRIKIAESELISLTRRLSSANAELEEANRRLTETNEHLLMKEKMLLEKESQFRLMSEQINIGIVFIQNGRVAFANQGLADLCGYTIEEMMAWPARGFAKVIHPDYLSWVIEFNERREKGEYDITSRKEVKIITSEGRIRPLEVFSRTVIFNGKHANLIALIDIEARKNAEENLSRLNIELETRIKERTLQLENANRDLSTFAYSVSHDLRAPLRSINGYAEILDDEFAESFSEKGRDYIKRLRNSGKYMNRLIEDFLKLSQVTRSDLRPQDVDLSVIVRKISTDLKTGSPSRQVEFLIQDGIHVNGDPSLLEIALSNLIENSWKYTSKHTTAIISFGMNKTGDKTEYYVKDDGAGFDMVNAGRLFGPFQRLHSENDFEGTGIGLAIVKAVMSRHNGRIRAVGAIEKGAAFYFELG